MIEKSSLKSIIAITMSIGMFIETLDTTIINTAIPVIAKNLSVSPIDLKIALISYLLSLALFIPISGWIADKFGQSTTYFLAVTIFTVGSILCGFSNSLNQLILARLLQGCGGALMMPVGRLIILRTFPRHELISAMNQIIILGLLGPALGPIIGGIITQLFSWRWIFFVNIPFGIISMFIAWKYIPNHKESNLHKLDILGFLLFGISLAVFIFTLSAFSESDMHLPTLILLMFISILGFIFYFLHSRNIKNPILDLSLLKIRTFRIAVNGNIICRIGISGIPFLLPLLFQVSFHYSPITSGSLIFPLALGAMFAKTFTKKLLIFLHPKKYLLINTILLGLSIILFNFITHQISFAMIAILVFINGVTSSTQYSGMNSLSYADVPNEKISRATSITTTIMQVMASIGVAISAILLVSFGADVNSDQYISAEIIHHVFTILGIITMLSALCYINLKSNDGEALYKAPV